MVPLPGRLKVAVITVSRVDSAVGPMESKPGCTVLGPGGKRFDPNDGPPFHQSALDSASFEKNPSSRWPANSYVFIPFPCRATTNPSNGNADLPLAVVNAVGLAYASTGCIAMYTPPPGDVQGH